MVLQIHLKTVAPSLGNSFVTNDHGEKPAVDSRLSFVVSDDFVIKYSQEESLRFNTVS